MTTRAEIEAALVGHHQWRTGEGVPTELITIEAISPWDLTDEDKATLATWRASAPQRLSLAGEDLSSLNLSGLDFRMVNLNGANLANADLRNANLSHADLRGAHLEGVRLSSTSVDESTRLQGIHIDASCGCLTSARTLLNALHGDTVSAQMKGLVDAINAASTP
jgi:uncharacterized protein YjbI with pentapeptide repeats